MRLQADIICGICGKPIRSKASKDHIFPRSVLKWTAEDNTALSAFINADYNTMPTHQNCNYNKQDSILNIGELYISQSQKEELQSAFSTVADFFDNYLAHKNNIILKQENHCFSCGCNLESHRILRRINPKQRRGWNNACIVCSSCNTDKVDFIECNKKYK